jgi:uncharacterized membrane protein
MIDLLTLAGMAGAGLIAGFFLAFSVCVMRAFGQVPPAHGIGAMQAVNVVVINPWFLVPFFGTVVVCIAATVLAFTQGAAGASWLLAASVVYAVGAVGVTMFFNVPKNNTLARLKPGAADSTRDWDDYRSTWTAWNHVRTIAALVAMLLLAMAPRHA